MPLAKHQSLPPDIAATFQVLLLSNSLDQSEELLCDHVAERCFSPLQCTALTLQFYREFMEIICFYSQPSLSLGLRHGSICWAGTELSDLYVVIRILATLWCPSLCC